MDLQTLTYLVVGFTFALYIAIAVWSRAGYGGSVFLMGWTGGYVILAMLLAPYLRKYGKFT